MEKEGNGRLDSWKEIAKYLHRDVTTTIRWEKEKSLPVHRVPGGKRQAVFAYRHEIDAWLNGSGSEAQAINGHGQGERAGPDPVQPNSALMVTGLSDLGDRDIAGTAGAVSYKQIGGEDTAATEEPPRESPPQPVNLEQAPHHTVSPEFHTPSPDKKTLEQRAQEQQLQVRQSRRTWLLASSAGIAGAILVAGFIAWSYRPQPAPEVGNARQLTHDRQEKAGPLVTDGARLYFCELAPQGCALTSVPVSGGETASVPTPFPSITLFDIWPKGSKLLIGSPVTAGGDSPLWIMPIGGGPPQPVDGVSTHEAAWSHDGTRIAYLNGSGLYTASIDGTAIHRLAGVGAKVAQIRWSPDDKRLRFSAFSGNPPRAIPWEVQADGTDLHQVLDGWSGFADGFYGDWPAGGKYYVFSILSDSGDLNIERLWVTREKPGLLGRRHPAPARLADDTRSYGWPRPSRDGRRLFVIGAERRGELVRYDAREQEFMPYLNGMEGRWVTFSPDGRWVAYSRYSDGTVWAAHPDGSGSMQLTYRPMYADGLAWSPDGRWIAIHAQRTPKAHYKICLLPAPTGNAPADPVRAEELLPNDKENEGIPSWSPDSRRIAYGEMDGPMSTEGTGNEVIHICDLASRQVAVLPGKKGVWTARWSPDGRYLAALTYDPRHRLELYEFKTRRWRELDAEHIDNPTWSHDSRYIYYDADGAEANVGVFRVRINDGKVNLAAPYKWMRIADHTWSGLAPDDSPIVLRAMGSPEIYSLDVKWP